jgi:hypothetical protein
MKVYVPVGFTLYENGALPYYPYFTEVVKVGITTLRVVSAKLFIKVVIQGSTIVY